MKYSKITVLLKFLFLINFLLVIACGKSKDGDINPAKSKEKDISSFSFKSLTPAVQGIINGQTITLTVPAGTDITALKPDIVISDKASIAPLSGLIQDFSKSVPYTVTAEDGSTQTYTIAVNTTPALTRTLDCNTTLPDILEDLGSGVDYIVNCNIGISKTLTIKPGVRIQFEGSGSGFTVYKDGALNMIGTSEKKIILEGKNNTPGSWTGVTVSGSSRLVNKWEYVTLKNAGGGGSGVIEAGLLLRGSDNVNEPLQIAINNCEFNDNIGYGIYLMNNPYTWNDLVSFKNNAFNNNSKSALSISISAISTLDASSSFINNGQKFIEITDPNTWSESRTATMNKIDVPYRVAGNIFLRTKVTIMAGVIIEFEANKGIDILETGAIIANGTAADPIKFLGYPSGVKGLWRGIEIRSSSLETAFSYCTIDGAGSDQHLGCMMSDNQKAALYFGANLCGNYPGRSMINNCSISNSGGYAIVFKTADAVSLTGNTYSGNTLGNIFNY